jgi:uncharacterized protein (DUF362 family)
MSIDRKHFIKLLGASAAAAALGGCGGGSESSESGSSSQQGARKPRPVALSGPAMSVVKGADARAITRRAVEELGGMGIFVSKGDKVLIKPNIGWDRVPAQAATTNPDVVAELCELCFNAGAAKVTVMDNSINDPRRCYVRSGIKKAAEALGADVPFLEDYNFSSVNVGGELIKQWPVYRGALEVDRIINVPIAKHHSLSRLSLGMKNFYGLMGGRRNQLHQDVHLSIAEMTRFFAPSLTVIDAVRILTGNGPSGGSLADVKQLDTVIASVDPVAADARAAGFFGVDPASIGHLELGSQMGIGTYDLGAIQSVEVAI